ncbi:MAG: MBL fold metallo-hydrolase [Candidatus Omnitrophota bacterium]
MVIDTVAPNVMRVPVGPTQTNCYIVTDERSKKAIIIDPGSEGQSIRAVLDKNRLEPVCIVNTHGHADHIGANAFLGFPVMIHPRDADFLTDPDKNLSGSFGFPIRSQPASRLLEDGESVVFGSSKVDVVYTPGHTPGSISLLFGGVVFTGDALFAGGIGRTDLPYGDEKALLHSIRTRLLTMDGSSVVLPGHGPGSTIRDEKTGNPFL